MSSTPPSGGTVFVEPLESRIAPTGVYAIAGDPGNTTAVADPHYVTFTNTPTGTSLHFVPASTYGVNVPHLFALQLTGDGSVDPTTGLSNGAELVIFNNATGFNLALPNVQSNKGTILAFFIDNPGANGGDATRPSGEVYASEFVGLAVGKKASLTVNGNVYGDIVTDLLHANTGNPTLSLTSAGNHGQAITGLSMNGNVYGNILAGGDIRNVTLIGTVDNILAGTATNGVPFDFSGGTAAPTGTIANAAAPGLSGANITGLTVSMLSNNGRIQAGDAGSTAIGGAVENVIVQADTNAFSILGGAGGDGSASVIGGAGGMINNVRVAGAAGTVANAQVLIQAGHGGNNGAGHAGAGGVIEGVAVGYDSFDDTINAGMISADLTSQNVTVRGGDGGDGLRGGNGGSVNDSAIVGLIPDDGVAAADGSANAEIQVFGGAGGVATTVGQGKGGHGGGIAQLTVENLNTTSTGLNSSILVQGGGGGAAKGGGNISNVDLLGTNLAVNGGAGGTGPGKGGDGGSLNSIDIENLTNLFAATVALNGGQGADGGGGYGGAGGAVAGVTLSDAQLTSLVIDNGTHANGGAGANGTGGAGGAVTNVTLNDFESSAAAIGSIAIRSGTGGAGSTGGGAGGTIDTLQLLGVNFNYSVATGAGGNATGGVGSAGAGGNLSNAGISNEPADPVVLANPTGLSGAVSTGAGGTGGLLGGAGGNLVAVNASAVYSISVTAGNAGDGATGAGAGGGFNVGAANSLQGGVVVMAGNGGQASGGASSGGSIDGFVVGGANSLTLVAGNGGSGGAGGSVTGCGSTVDALTGLPNLGDLTVTAGNGTSQNGVAGSGGAIDTFNGNVSINGYTAFTAGAGGGGLTSTASGRGGNIDSIRLTGSGGASAAVNGITSQVITFDAGSAGEAGQAVKGKPGGDVSNITVYDLDAGSIVQHIAAGDGSNGLVTGKGGGNVTEVHIGLPGDTDADIGYRSGVSYGYALGSAGGIFAGFAGTGATKSGHNGSVSDVTANAIASIVAGKGVPQLCGTVDGIFLDGLTVPVADDTGAFSNFGSANIVGSILNPTAAGASTYASGDGLIAAANLTGNRNFVPEALLTLDASGNLVLVDEQEPNPTPVVTLAPTSLTA